MTIRFFDGSKVLHTIGFSALVSCLTTLLFLGPAEAMSIGSLNLWLAKSGVEHPATAATQSVWALTFFWFLAAMTLGSALFVITRRNLVAAVIGMIATFFGLAGLFLMLYAGFLASIQVLVYAGAIMVLFVFVIMILNREEEEPWAVQGLLGKGLAGFGLLYLLAKLSSVLWGMNEVKTELPAPGPSSHHVGDQLVSYPFGSVKGVGYTLFTDYLFPFEAVSLVLLVAVVGAIAVARPHEAGPKFTKKSGGV